MAVSDEIVNAAGDITLYPGWKAKLADMTRIGERYIKGEARRYYTDGRGGYYYRPITEAEMHRYK